MHLFVTFDLKVVDRLKIKNGVKRAEFSLQIEREAKIENKNRQKTQKFANFQKVGC
jgi:hypothetical protein